MTTEPFHPDFKLVTEAVAIHSPTQYSILGELRDFTAASAFAGTLSGGGESQAETTQPDDARLADPVFMPSLETDLYARLYTRPTFGASPASDPLAQRDHISALSAANNGMGTWEPGWRIISIEEDGRVAVTKDQVTFWVPPTGLRTWSGKIHPADYCRVWVGKEMRQLVTGFYFAIGNGDQQDSRDATGRLLRFYWHLTTEAAVEYMALVTSSFNRAGIPFRTKVMADPASYVRADAGVLYLERSHFPAARRLILEIYQHINSKMRPAVPMFTKPLADGLGLAEDPSNHMSFGQSRCRIAARALWDCFARGVAEPEARLAAVAEAFRAEGLDPETPFLEKGSRDVYAMTGELPTMSRLPPSAAMRAERQRRSRKKGHAKKSKKAGAR